VLRVYEHVNVSRSNSQYVVVEVDETEFGLSRDQLRKVLTAGNVIARRYFYPGAHRCLPWAAREPGPPSLPNTERLCDRLLQLPTGALVADEDVATICDLVQAAKEQASRVRKAF
ncbi:MAG: DegT/DnrJ/EryC1/StrS family aminotransferase, partial [Hyphomicrobiales bacterium]|nr:DegT/DnrJ/EryC1/StrS family aminotransferase [Hyphomicrobiales bacterium]